MNIEKIQKKFGEKILTLETDYGQSKATLETTIKNSTDTAKIDSLKNELNAQKLNIKNRLAIVGLMSSQSKEFAVLHLVIPFAFFA